MSVKNICNMNECTGCAACANVCHLGAVSMKPDKEGFLYPVIDAEKCVDCGACRKICPNNNVIVKNDASSVYLAWNTDDAVRCTSTSGGIFYSLASLVIGEGGVVFGSVMDEDGIVHHEWTDNIEGLHRMQGSKYVQSSIGDSYKQAKSFLASGRKVLFTGTPCQISGLYGSIGNRDAANLYTIDIVCHGVPSQQAFVRYFSLLQKKYGPLDVLSYRFRDVCRWNVDNSVVINGERVILSKEDNLYFLLFVNDYILRESCYVCKYASTARISDITVGDFWGIRKYRPGSDDVSKGCSIVLPNTEKGVTMLNAVSSSMYLESRKISEASANAPLFGPARRSSDRNIAYDYLNSHSLSRTYYKFFSTYFKYLRHSVYGFLKKLK